MKDEIVSDSRKKEWYLPKNLKLDHRKSCKPGKPRKVTKPRKEPRLRKLH